MKKQQGIGREVVGPMIDPVIPFQLLFEVLLLWHLRIPYMLAGR
jgi:hypothetical protein